MQITLTSKVQILPDEDTKKVLLDTLRAYKDACNYVSTHIFVTNIMSPKVLHNDLYYKLREKFGLRAQMTTSVLRTVLKQYQILRPNKYPLKPIRFNKPQIDLLWRKDYSLLGECFSISTIEGRKKMRFNSYEASLEGRFGTAKLLYRHNKFYLYIPASREVPDVNERDIVNVVGVDRGVRFSATTYDTRGKTTFYSGAKIKEKRIHYASVKKQLQQAGTSSSRKRLKAIGRREHRWMQNVNHCISKALVESQPKNTLFVLEDLTGIQTSFDKFRSKHRLPLNSWAFFDLEQKIKYKAALRGQMVIKVDPAFTSQTCPLCGKRSRSSRIKSKHLFRCTKCRYKSNDDRVAAINLYGKGIKYLVQSEGSIAFFGGAESAAPNASPALESASSKDTATGDESRILQGRCKLVG